ncbi:MAG: CoB--CoM heterodisulfide reductase iron-sulfur subunit B family protein [Magnetococcales bacterium]|nr:CoB--CoM heterodisulfide reductase iron-sulfur subunit B family protein [Magnetococcales bacterium]
MTLEFAYYPGCAAKQIQREADWAARAVCQELGIGLLAMPRASCCGAVSLRETKPAFALAVAARILSEAEAMGKDLVTICNTCLQTLTHANYRLSNEPELLEKINAVLAESGVRPYGGTIKVRHLLWVVTDLVDSRTLKAKITHPLKGLRVAAFLGCHSIRPEEIFNHASNTSEGPHLERLIQLMGGVPVDYVGKDRCCGFHVMLSDKHEVHTMAAKNCLSAKDAGAQVMITPCTLCDMIMGSVQPIAEKTVQRTINLPEMNFAQLLGLTMGISKERLGISRLHIDPVPVLSSIGLA